MGTSERHLDGLHGGGTRGDEQLVAGLMWHVHTDLIASMIHGLARGGEINSERQERMKKETFQNLW